MDVANRWVSSQSRACSKSNLLLKDAMPHLSACTVQKIVHRTAESSAAFRSICVSVVAIALTGCGSGVGLLAPSATGGAPAVQPSAVAASPELGYLWSTPEHMLRPILGVPGSSQLGAPLLSSGDTLAAEASAASSSALIEQSNGALIAVHLPDGAPIPVSSGIVGDLKLRFAPQGVYAIAFVPGGSTISLISGLPDTPQLQAIPLAIPGLVDAAVGDSGQVLVATSSGSRRCPPPGSTEPSASASRVTVTGPSSPTVRIPASSGSISPAELP